MWISLAFGQDFLPYAHPLMGQFCAGLGSWVFVGYGVVVLVFIRLRWHWCQRESSGVSSRRCRMVLPASTLVSHFGSAEKSLKYRLLKRGYWAIWLARRMHFPTSNPTIQVERALNPEKKPLLWKEVSMGIWNSLWLQNNSSQPLFLNSGRTLEAYKDCLLTGKNSSVWISFFAGCSFHLATRSWKCENCNWNDSGSDPKLKNGNMYGASRHTWITWVSGEWDQRRLDLQWGTWQRFQAWRRFLEIAASIAKGKR